MDGLGAYESESDGNDGANNEGEVPLESNPPCKKRARMIHAQAMLPGPSIRSATSKDCMISWDKDYLTPLQEKNKMEQEYMPYGLVCDDKIEASTARLDRVAAMTKNDPSGGWVEHLLRQKDFYNPHFFASVVEGFSIDPVGSNIPTVHLLCYDPEWESVEPLMEREQQCRSQNMARPPT